jgi:putative RNA 2'-phosphotransferase
MTQTMQSKQITKLSKKLSWLLRHGARDSHLDMDEAGWVACEEVLRATGMNRSQLLEAVQHNNKSRLQLEGDRIRACQGHSFEGTPVTREALEASWDSYEEEGTIWHGTSLEAVEGIAREGILPGNRTHVHLAASTDSRVGKRFNTPVLLEVSVDRLRASSREVFVSPNGVVLVRDVPSSCIVGLVTQSAKADKAKAALLRRWFRILPSPTRPS